MVPGNNKQYPEKQAFLIFPEGVAKVIFRTRLRGFTSCSSKVHGFDILYFFCPGHNELATEAIADVTDKIERPFILIGRS